MKLYLADEAATMRLAEGLFAAMPAEAAGYTLLLEGDLGAGKSTFARAFIRSAGHDGPIPSPTYTLVEPYELPVGRIYHIDLYRIAGEEELRYLGWSEFGNGLRLIEWPERCPSVRDDADLEIQLSYAGEGREVELSALSERGTMLLSNLEAENG